MLAQGTTFRAALNSERAKYKLSPTRKYLDPQGRAVTPAVVFLNAGHLLDALARLIEADPKGKNMRVGEIYDVPKFSGKTPSHVFDLAELASRRVALITEK